MIVLDKGVINSINFESLQKACKDTAEQVPLLSGMNYSFVNTTNLIYNCPLTDCSTSMNDVARCDPKLYVSWVGTDAKGKYLTSANLKITNFNNYNMSKIFSDLIGHNTNNHDNPDSPVAYNTGAIAADVKTRLNNPESGTASTSTATTTTSSTLTTQTSTS